MTIEYNSRRWKRKKNLGKCIIYLLWSESLESLESLEKERFLVPPVRASVNVRPQTETQSPLLQKSRLDILVLYMY